MGIVYKATNLINNKCYIGKTIQSLKKRIQNHVYYAIKKKSKSYFHDAIRKYNIENFKWEILYECEITEIINIMETFMIMIHKTHVNLGGYNLTWGGDGGDTFTNCFDKESFRKKCSIASKKRIITEELRRKTTERFKNKNYIELYGESKANIIKNKLSKSHKNLSDESRKNMSDAQTGKIRSKESIQKRIETMKGKKRKYHNINHYICITPDNREIKVYNLVLFCKDNNLSVSHMYAVSNGKLKTHKKWKCRRDE